MPLIQKHPSLSNIHTVPERILWMDYAKGIGIFLVVLGHTIRGLMESPTLESSGLLKSADQWIYAFHMPLFFFLSGLLIERAVTKPFKEFVVSRFQTLAYPYVVWSILQELLRFLSGKRTDSLGELWRIVYQPVMQFWFLYVLLIVSCVYVVLRRRGVSVNVFFLICIFLYGAHLGGLNFGSWGVVYITRMNAIYFGLGAFTAQTGILSRWSQVSPKFLLSGAIAGFAAITAAVWLNLTEMQPFIPLLASLGIFASFALAQFLVLNAPQDFLRNWGCLSLQIFVAHIIFSSIARVFLQKVHAEPVVQIIFGTAFGIYGSIFLYWACKKIRFPYAYVLRPAKT
jgi:fucose 4-O-acetylase-like acetyltransferase